MKTDKAFVEAMKELKNSLVHGDIKKMSEESGISEIHFSMIFRRRSLDELSRRSKESEALKVVMEFIKDKTVKMNDLEQEVLNLAKLLNENK